MGQAAAAEILQRRWEQATGKRNSKRDDRDRDDRDRDRDRDMDDRDQRDRDRDRDRGETRSDPGADGDDDFGSPQRDSSLAGVGESASSSRTVPAPTPMPKFQLGKKLEKPDAQANVLQEKRKNAIKNVFASGMDDEDDNASTQKEEFE